MLSKIVPFFSSRVCFSPSKRMLSNPLSVVHPSNLGHDCRTPSACSLPRVVFGNNSNRRARFKGGFGSIALVSGFLWRPLRSPSRVMMAVLMRAYRLYHKVKNERNSVMTEVLPYICDIPFYNHLSLLDRTATPDHRTKMSVYEAGVI